MEDAATLRANLSRLRARCPALADSVAAASLDGIRFESGRPGATSLSCDGVLLASAYAPEAEGRQLADAMQENAGDLTVAIGFGLGHHLEIWRERHPGPLVIFEPSPARLRAALGLRPLPWLESESVWFAEDAMGLGDHLARLYTPGLRIAVFVHPATPRLAPQAVQRAVERLGRVKDNVDMSAVTRVQCVEGWTRLCIENTPHLLRTPRFSGLEGAFRGVPAVVAAAGPSLDRQLPRLAREAERLLILAVGPSLGALRAHGIQPDLVHVLESTDVAHQLTRSGPTHDLALVLTPKVHPGLFELPVGARFVAYTATERFGCWMAEALGDSHVIPGEPSVALSSVRLAAALGANPILIVGQDLAFSDGRVYASGSCYEDVGFRAGADGDFTYTALEQKLDVYRGDRRQMQRAARQPLVWVEGWKGERIPTCPAYAQFVDCYRDLGETLARGGVRLVNCTEGGARIPGIEHARFAEALAACPSERVASRERIQQVFDAAPPVDPGIFREPLARTRRTLERLEKQARRGVRETQEAARRLGPGVAPDRAVAELRRASRAERRVRRALGGTPWLEALVQAEIHQAVALQRQASRAQPTPEEAVAECLLLLRATLDGVGKARALFDRFEALALAGSAPPGPTPPAPRAAGVTP